MSHSLDISDSNEDLLWTVIEWDQVSWSLNIAWECVMYCTHLQLRRRNSTFEWLVYEITISWEHIFIQWNYGIDLWNGDIFFNCSTHFVRIRRKIPLKNAFNRPRINLLTYLEKQLFKGIFEEWSWHTCRSNLNKSEGFWWKFSFLTALFLYCSNSILIFYFTDFGYEINTQKGGVKNCRRLMRQGKSFIGE